MCAHRRQHMLPLFTSYIKTVHPRHFPLRENMHMYCTFSALACYWWRTKSMFLSSIMYTRYTYNVIHWWRNKEWRVENNSKEIWQFYYLSAMIFTTHIQAREWLFEGSTCEDEDSMISEIMRMSDPASQHNKPEELNPQCQCCGNLTSLYVLLYYIRWICAMSKNCEMKEKLISYYV